MMSSLALNNKEIFNLQKTNQIKLCSDRHDPLQTVSNLLECGTMIQIFDFFLCFFTYLHILVLFFFIYIFLINRSYFPQHLTHFFPKCAP